MAMFGDNKYCPSCMEELKNENDVCPVCGYDSDTTVSPRYLKPGSIINDRYVAGVVLGENTFSVTYMGMDLAEKKKKVIKEYCPFSCATRNSNEFEESSLNVIEGKKDVFEKGLEEFSTLGKKLRDLGQNNALPGIMHVTNLVSANDTCYMISDYVEGQTLRKLAKKNKLSPSGIFSMARPIIHSLQILHKNGVIHGNISPLNILVSDDRKNAVLVGFGIPSSVSVDSAFSSAAKPGFTPIEQYAAFKDEVGPWTDIYGMSSSLYFALTGVVPTDSPDRTVNDDVDSFADLDVRVSDDKTFAIEQGMNVRREDRFKAVRALYNAMYSEDEDIEYAPEETVKYDDGPAVKKEVVMGGPKTEVKAEVKEEPKTEAKAEVKEEPKAEAKPEVKTVPVKPVQPQNNGRKEYSQVIISRRDKDNAVIGDKTYPTKLEKLELMSIGLNDDDTHSMNMMTNLEYLYLDENCIGNIEFLDSMRKLVVFSAKNNFITDISVLVNLSKLRELYLGGNSELKDISVLEHLRGIRKLDLSNTAITDVHPIIYLDQLKMLDLRGTAVTEKQVRMLFSEMPSCDIRYDVKKRK